MFIKKLFRYNSVIKHIPQASGYFSSSSCLYYNHKLFFVVYIGQYIGGAFMWHFDFLVNMIENGIKPSTIIILHIWI